jgi:hypothetical protein
MVIFVFRVFREGTYIAKKLREHCVLDFFSLKIRPFIGLQGS